MKTKEPSLKQRFNTASVAPKALTILRDYCDPITGATLACAEIPALYADRAGLKSGPIYLVGWIPAGRRTMLDGSVCRSLGAAATRFNTQRKIGHPPRNNDHFTHDAQRQHVYDWESRNTGNNDITLGVDKMVRVLQTVSNDFGMKTPSFRYKKAREDVQEYNYYLSSTHTIEMREKRLSVLLHELAHALDHHINKNKTNVHHGPSFTRTLICLSAQYRHYAANDLEKRMIDSGIAVAPLESLPALKIIFNSLQKKQRAHIVSRIAPGLK
jgi:hypothetical protein